MRIKIFFFLPLILLSSCISYAPRIKLTDVPKEDSAYIYGRFRQETNIPNKDYALTIATGILIASADSEETYAIRFYDNNEVYAIEVMPGNYYISKWIWSDPFGEISLELPLKDNIENNNFQMLCRKAVV